MDFETWKQNLVNEIETAAAACAERSLADMDDPTFAKSQKALFAMAQTVKNLPADAETLQTLFEEEKELSELMRAVPGEPEQRYYDAKEELLRSIGFQHDTFEDPSQFLGVLRNLVDETVTEYRLQPYKTA